MLKKIFVCFVLICIPLVAICQEVFVNVPKAKIYCHVVGKGSPVIVIHGGPGLTQDYLLPYMERIAKSHQVIFYDQRGSGKSTGEISNETMQMDVLVQDIEAIRKQLGFEKISILGHSLGGLVAMNYALTHPDKVNKLILMNSCPATSEDVDSFLQEYLKRTKPYQETLNQIKESKGFKEGDPEVFEKYFRILFTSYVYKKEDVCLLNLRLSKETCKNYPKILELLIQNVLFKPYNLSSSLKEFKRPTLIVHGAQDVVPPFTVEKIHQYIEGSTYILIPECGHFPYVEKPEELFPLLDEFLKDDV